MSREPKLKGPWTCPICTILGQRTTGVGYEAFRLHNKAAHGAKPGWKNLGKRGKKPTHWRSYQGKAEEAV